MSTPVAILIGAAIGAGLLAPGIIAYEWLTTRPRKARQRGDYLRADQPFAIVCKPAARGAERSDGSIAREAHRIARRTYGQHVGDGGDGAALAFREKR